ncbi:EF-P lysine aminoacylase GenX [Candidatus Gottesmanbacteria bacterium RBG_16_43_7]|uniref:EF-P lysine aminoacylase GenX n=1 Tax=Candidatus Gottesmanbacteria bacterium RBG_16_43_7 TaxID=1798373 RepID=A0A1F5Z849_9BACT|nr:MAG: EF-P lysine aminoacylase GenX [Candidatus Gottesmanbacteria bacterium RBG_16_43_7]
MKTWQKLRAEPGLWQRYFMREQVLTAIRRFFLDRDFHEVETPLLTGSLPPESYLDIFATTLNWNDKKQIDAFLTTSPEPFLKKLLVAGIGNCFALTKSFRNSEGVSKTHNPEFTILEWYRSGADYYDIMRDCEELLIFINTYLQRSQDKNAHRVQSTKVSYQGKTVDLARSWERVSIVDAFKRYAHVDLMDCLSRETLMPVTQKKGYRVTALNTWEEMFHRIFLNEIEPQLGRGKPTIIFDYPAELAALSKKKTDDPRFAERFEFYIEGLELGDAYSELTDWKEQLIRFKAEYQKRQALGKVMHPIDMDFISALKAGLPQTGGIAVGVDRLIMLFADVGDIAQTMFFPATDLFEAP